MKEKATVNITYHALLAPAATLIKHKHKIPV